MVIRDGDAVSSRGASYRNRRTRTRILEPTMVISIQTQTQNQMPVARRNVVQRSPARQIR